MPSAEMKEITINELFTVLKQIWQYFLSKWLLIFSMAVVCGLLGVLYAWLKKPEYVAEITFVSETDNSSKLGLYAGIASQFGVDLGGSSSGIFEGESLMELLQSRTMVEKTLLTRFADSSPKRMIEIFMENQDKEWRTNPKTKDIHFEAYPEAANRQRDSIMSKVYETITKDELQIDRRDKKTSFITIQMKDNNELFAKRFAEALVNNAVQYYSDYKSKKARQNLQIIQNQTDSVRGMLFGNITDVAVLNDLNINPVRQSSRTGSQRKQVDVQVNSILYGELLKNLELSRLALRKETPLIQIIDLPVLPLKKIKPGRLLTGITFAVIGTFILSFILLIKFISSLPTQKKEVISEGPTFKS